MDEIENLYLLIIAELKTLQTARLSKERLIPFQVDVHKTKKDTFLSKYRSLKKEKQRRRIAEGFHSGVEKSIQRVRKTYKQYLKNVQQNKN